LTRDDSLAIAAAVERRLANEERAHRAKVATPMPPQQAESLRAVSWQHFADSVRDAMVGGRALGPMRVVPMPDLRRMVPDSATIAALARAATGRYERFGPGATPGAAPGGSALPRPEVRVDARLMHEEEVRNEAAAWVAKFGERLPPPKPGVRRVLVLDLHDGTGRADLAPLATTESAAIRRAVAGTDGYEAIDASSVRDVLRVGASEAALAAVTHSGAVVNGFLTAQRDSSVGVIAVVHDATRGYAFSVRPPRVPAAAAQQGALAETAAATLVKALDRVHWNP